MLFNVKMRAECALQHISGAERIVKPEDISCAVQALTQRALTHPKGYPDQIVVTVKRLQLPVLTLSPLPVVEQSVHNTSEAQAVLAKELQNAGYPVEPILTLFNALPPMRGAILLHSETMQRLEPDLQRGVRATCLDYVSNKGTHKCHFQEALCLATKVASCPFISGELCLSDDPDYTTGYFASKHSGYVRIPYLKRSGDPRGGRIFLFQGTEADLHSCIEYLEQQPVLVTI